jgi:hypothetical protein
MTRDADVLRAKVLRLHDECVTCRNELAHYECSENRFAWLYAERAFRTALDALVLTSQDAGLEQAAKVAETYAYSGYEIAKSIRALKTRPDAEEKAMTDSELPPERIAAKLLIHSKGPHMHPELQDDIMEAAECIRRLAHQLENRNAGCEP